MDFLNKRDNDPQDCRPVPRWCAAKSKKPSAAQPIRKETAKSLAAKLERHLDLLKSRDVAKITG